jgi:aspartyl-tRNA synthetase
MEKLIKLESVGSFYNTQTGNVYPMQTNDKPDLKMGMKLSECSDEFKESLSNQDYNKIVKIHLLRF